MKKWIWLLLLVLTTVAVVSCSEVVKQGKEPLVVETMKVEKLRAQAQSQQLVHTTNTL